MNSERRTVDVIDKIPVYLNDNAIRYRDDLIATGPSATAVALRFFDCLHKTLIICVAAALAHAVRAGSNWAAIEKNAGAEG